MRLYGLIGKPLTHSFSKKYFAEKCTKEHIANVSYELFPLDEIHQLTDLLASTPDLKGLNVTIPYKQKVIPFLQSIDEGAQKIGACNCIKISEGHLKGFNTDAPAFRRSLLSLLQPHHKKALVLGTGGAAKAVTYTLHQLNIEHTFVSRSRERGWLYEDLTKDILAEHPLIINTTPLGSFPNVHDCPDIPYTFLSSRNYLYDLVYNPPETLFLQKGKAKGAIIKNGYEMLVGQAEMSWQIWNNPDL